MPWSINWSEDHPNIVEAVLCDPVSPADAAEIFEAWYAALDSRDGPLFCLLDLSNCREVDIAFIVDRRLLRMADYVDKLRAIAMIPCSEFSMSIARVVGAMFGYRDWFQFVSSPEEGMRLLRALAAREAAHVWRP